MSAVNRKGIRYEVMLMAYYVRVFCQSSAIPPLRVVFEWVTSEGYQLRLDPTFAHTDLDSSDWEQIGILYKDGKSALLTEINRDHGSDERLFHEEIREFEGLLTEAKNSSNGEETEKVLEHVHHTKYIVANQIPSDFDDDGSLALSSFLAYFINHCGGMVQADGEGFYDGDRLIVRLE